MKRLLVLAVFLTIFFSAGENIILAEEPFTSNLRDITTINVIVALEGPSASIMRKDQILRQTTPMLLGAGIVVSEEFKFKQSLIIEVSSFINTRTDDIIFMIMCSLGERALVDRGQESPRQMFTLTWEATRYGWCKKTLCNSEIMDRIKSLLREFTSDYKIANK